MFHPKKFTDDYKKYVDATNQRKYGTTTALGWLHRDVVHYM